MKGKKIEGGQGFILRDRQWALQNISEVVSEPQFGRLYRSGVFRYYYLKGKVCFKEREFWEDLEKYLEPGPVVNADVNDWREKPFFKAKLETKRD